MIDKNNERLEELTRAICSAPQDTDAVLVCADHLEERGDRRARYLRGQLALRPLDRDRGPLLAELRALYPAEHAPWLGRLEQAGVIESNLPGLPAAWWGQDLPSRPGEGPTPSTRRPICPACPWPISTAPTAGCARRRSRGAPPPMPATPRRGPRCSPRSRSAASRCRRRCAR